MAPGRRSKSKSPAKPWSKAKAAARILSPDDRWADELYARMLGDCHQWQRDAAEDPARRITMLVGRGGAKTTTKRVRALRKITKLRGARVLYIAPSRSTAEEINWGKLKDMCDAYGLRASGPNPDVTFNETKLRLTCNRTGSTYRLVGADDKKEIEKLRGQSFDEVQIDEAASYPNDLLEQLIDRVIAPRLGERSGCIVLGGTPGHRLGGRFYEATRNGSALHRPYAKRNDPEFAGFKGWSSHAWDLEQVASLPDAERLYPALVANWREALLEKETNGWSDDHPIWKREWKGEWAADNTTTIFRYSAHKDGEPWNQWDPFGDGHKLEGVLALKAAIAKLPAQIDGRPQTWHYVATLDQGHGDPFACTILAFSPTDPTRKIRTVYSFEKTGMYGKLIAELLLGLELNHEKPAGIFGVIGHPDDMIIDADLALIAELANVYGLRFKKAEKKMDYKFGAIELVNGDFIEGRIDVLKGSPLELELLSLQWKEDEYGQLREDKGQANHSTDTLIYGRRLIAHLFESGAISADVSTEKKKPGYVDPQGLDDGGDDPPDEFAALLADPSYADSDWGNG